MRRLWCASVLGVWWLLQAAPLVAQQSEARELTAAGFPLVRGVPVGEGPVMDGDVLNDPAYADAVLATGFVQSRPFEGQPASERTEVRIAYTARHDLISEWCAIPKTRPRSSLPTAVVIPT